VDDFKKLEGFSQPDLQVVIGSTVQKISQKDLILDKLNAIKAMKALMNTLIWREWEGVTLNFNFKQSNEFLQFMEGQRYFIQGMKNLLISENLLKAQLNKPAVNSQENL